MDVDGNNQIVQGDRTCMTILHRKERRMKNVMWSALLVIAGGAVTAGVFVLADDSKARRQIMKREIIRVEPFDSNFEKWGVPVSTCTRPGDMIFISGMPPFDPKTGELLVNALFEQQAERSLEELKTALEAAGSDLEHVLKINVLCVNPERFKAFNEIYKDDFPKNPPARIFLLCAGMDGPV